MKTVVLSQKIHPAAMAMLEEKYRVIYPDPPVQEGFEALLPEADAVVLRTNVKMTTECFAKAPSLKVAARTGAGVDSVDLEAARKAGVVVTNTPRANSVSVAEHAVAMALALSKQLPKYDEATRSENWLIRATNQAVELFGKTVGIVGLGHIGRLAAEMFRCGFQMKVIAYDPFVDPKTCPEYTVTADVKEVFANADVISVHCPSLPQTRGMVNKDLLSLVKKGAIFVNCARGDVMVEEDVVAALQDGTLSGAGLDVFSTEPIRPDSPFIGMDNVILTPHSAALTKEASIRMATQAAEQVILCLEGKDPEFIVK